MLSGILTSTIYLRPIFGGHRSFVLRALQALCCRSHSPSGMQLSFGERSGLNFGGFGGKAISGPLQVCSTLISGPCG
jgi:hypothetical protein